MLINLLKSMRPVQWMKNLLIFAGLIFAKDVSQVDLNFSVGDNMASRVGNLFWFSPLKVLQYFLFHTPLVYLFVFGSAFYHDFLWFPTRGRHIVNRWRKTKWGKLFETY